VSGSNESRTEIQKGIHNRDPEIEKKKIINANWFRYD
jgi:hypothetical protein